MAPDKAVPNDAENANGPPPPTLVRLDIQRFRGIEQITWHPAPGVNVLLGGGDVGKTTLLDAVALLLAPTNTTQVGESDYWVRNVDKGFCIEGVFKLHAGSDVLSDLKQTAWPWEWDGTEPIVPDLDSEPDDSVDTVLVFRVSGTADFELSYEIVQPNGQTLYLPVAVRRRIGLVWLEGDDRSDRDLRLVYGSALDRLLTDRALRSRLAQGIAAEDIGSHLNDEAKANLKRLDGAFKARALPAGLDIGLTGSKRLSINALIGLTASRGDCSLPVSSWGAGTRRLAALAITAINQSGFPLTVVDEIERGLEPHRQRALMRALIGTKAQALVTTHSTVVVGASWEAAIWYMSAGSGLARLRGPGLTHASRDPEAFLSRLTIVAEGAAEVGFVREMLSRALDGLLLERGVWVTDGQGNDSCLKLLTDLSKAGLTIGGFVDFEGRKPKKWRSLAEAIGPLLFQWEAGCLEENVIRLFPEKALRTLMEDPEGERSGMRLRTLQDRLGTTSKEWEVLKSEAEDIRSTIIEAATGAIPANLPRERQKEFKSHERSWFKSVRGGRELAQKCLDRSVWPALEPQILPFINAIRKAVDAPVRDRL